MSKLLKRDKLKEDNSYHISQLAVGIASIPTISDVAYDEGTWNANTDGATKNVIRDKFETLEDVYEAYFGIGIANKRWCQCIIEGVRDATDLRVATTITNLTAGGHTVMYGIPLPPIIGTKNLIITRYKVGLYDADASDYLNAVTLYASTGATNFTSLNSDGTNRTAAGDYTYDPADATIGGTYSHPFYYLQIQSATAAEFDLTYFLVEYYYG